VSRSEVRLGAFIVVVFGVIAARGYDGLVAATFMAGIILLIAGYSRAGALVRHVPEPVINGFTIGIAIIIATSQLRISSSQPAESASELPRDRSSAMGGALHPERRGDRGGACDYRAYYCPEAALPEAPGIDRRRRDHLRIGRLAAARRGYDWIAFRSLAEPPT
jgi:hypothetical protein